MQTLLPKILGVVAPLAVVGVTLFIAVPRAALGEPPDARRRRFARAAAALGMGLAYAAGHYAILRWPGFPPIDAADWTFYLAPVVALTYALAALIGAPRWHHLPLLAAPLGVFFWLLLRPLLEFDWSPLEAVAWIGGATLAVVALGLSQQQLAARLGGTRLAFILLIGAVTAAAVLLLSGTAKLAQLCGCVAAGVGVFWALGWMRRSADVFDAAGWIATPVVCGLLAAGHSYGSLRLWAALAVALIPALPWVFLAPPLRRFDLWRRAGVVEALVLLAATCAVLSVRIAATLENALWIEADE